MKDLRAIEIEINSHCNRACSYCPNADQERLEKGSMTHETFFKILHQLDEIKFSGRLSFSFYNEPLLSLDLDFFVFEAKKKLPQVNLVLYTNGTLLTVERILKLLALGVDQFIITKHESENDHTYIFDKTFSRLDQDIIKHRIKYQSYKDLKLTNRGGLITNLNKGELPINQPCLIPIHMMTITNQGTVLPCFEDYHQTQSAGNIHNHTLLEIWNSKSYMIFRKKLALGLRSAYPICNQCDRIEIIGVH